MIRLTKTDIKHPSFIRGLDNVIQRGVRSIKEQYNDKYNLIKAEDTIPELRKQRILMEKLYYAMIYNKEEINIRIKERGK